MIFEQFLKFFSENAGLFFGNSLISKKWWFYNLKKSIARSQSREVNCFSQILF